MKVAVTCIQLIRDLPEFRAALEQAGVEVVVPDIAGQHLEGNELVAALTGCVGVVAGDDRYTADVLERCAGLRVISKWGIGIDGIDQGVAAERGIAVTNTPGVFDDEVADVSMAYITILARGLHVIDRGVRQGIWPKPAGRSLRGMALGIVGLGGIGRALATRAHATGMAVLGTDPSEASCQAARQIGVETVAFEELLTRSEAVSINCPLNASTHHLFDAAAFGAMRRGSLLVNTGRGAVVSNEALVDALRDGTVAAAALDVMEHEPPPPNDPLRGFDNVVFGSHNASNTIEASLRVHRLALANLASALGIDLRLS